MEAGKTDSKEDAKRCKDWLCTREWLQNEHKKLGTQKLCQTYQANTLSKSCACRKCVEDMDHLLEGSHDFAVFLLKSGVGPSLMLESVHDRVGCMAILELSSERVVDQFEPSLFFIALEGSVEEQLRPSTRRIVHHNKEMEEMCREVEK